MPAFKQVQLGQALMPLLGSLHLSHCYYCKLNSQIRSKVKAGVQLRQRTLSIGSMDCSGRVSSYPAFIRCPLFIIILLFGASGSLFDSKTKIFFDILPWNLKNQYKQDFAITASFLVRDQLGRKCLVSTGTSKSNEDLKKKFFLASHRELLNVKS